MKRVFILFVSSSLALYSCQSETTTENTSATTEEVAHEHGEESSENEIPPAPGSYGAEFDASNPISVTELHELMAKNDSVDGVVVKAELSEVCQKMGCWVKIKNEGGEDIFVKMRGHEFFVPKDAAGRTCIISGDVKRDVTPVDELRHYAEDAGESEEAIAAITEPKVELQFDAAGIVIE